MTEELEMCIELTEDQMKKSMEHLEVELTKIRAGKANPSMVSDITVDYYGVITPLNQVANIATPDARTISIQPWEKNMLEPIEKAILAANIGLTPQNNGEMVILNIPPLTEERRQQLVKQVKHAAEMSKVGLRNARKHANDEIKKLQKEGLSEDLAKDGEDRIQEMTDQYTEEIDKYVKAKEKEIMTV